MAQSRNKTLEKYQEEYIKDNSSLFTISQLAKFMGIKYIIMYSFVKKKKLKYRRASCKIEGVEYPSIEDYKEVFPVKNKS